jgi:hypothetical protein
MAKIYRTSDRIKIQIDDVVVTISPLSYHQKMDAQSDIANGQLKKDFNLMNSGIIKSLKYAIKDVKGLVDAKGKPYKLEFIDGVLSEQCVDDIFNIELHKKLTMVCAALMSGVPSEFTDQDGNKIEGVEIISDTKKDDSVPN